jgi:hypothetical protein
MIDQRIVRVADRFDGERVAVRRIGERLNDSRNVVDVGEAVPDKEDRATITDKDLR